MTYRLLSVLLVILHFSSFSQINKENVTAKGKLLYLSNTVVVKLKTIPDENLLKSGVIPGKLNTVLGSLNVYKSKLLFSLKENEQTGLKNIIIINYSADQDPLEISAKLAKLGEVEWAEPKYLYKTDLFIPNDSSFSQQYNLAKIEASEAWDITKGDTNIIISITDTGIDWDHPDLSGNIWINRGEVPNNGIDDDHNGFTDDIRGWDFGGLTGTPDNNPMEDNPYHGTHVAGIASAVSNNGRGIASIGFQSRLMAIKVVRDNLKGEDNTPLISYGFEGITYAAENGAKIINCSWGGEGYSRLGQEVVNFALSKGALVVAAAGNDQSSNPSYPASYDGVLSVASSDRNDVKSSFSNYGSRIDVSAPGSSIYSTWMNNTYRTLSGTSMSTPLAAGLAALVAARFPNYSPLQTGEQVRVTCDDIYIHNSSFEFQLGKGRINAFNALNNVNAVSVRAVEVSFTDEAPGGNGDNVFNPGETISIQIKFRNYLNAASNLNITLESPDPGVTVQNGSFSPGSVAASDSFFNLSKFTISLANSLPLNHPIILYLKYSDGDYSDFQAIETFANPTFATQRGNNISMTINGKGNLGFNDYPNNLQGDGFRYLNSPNLLFEGALMIASSASRVSDAARNQGDANGQNSDFTPVLPFRIISEGNDSVHGFAEFDDSNAGSGRFGIDILLDSYTFSDISSRNYIILKYRIINRSADIISGLYPGLFFDWDLAGGPDDLASYDTGGQFGFVYNAAGGIPWVAAGVASVSGYGFWAINNGGDNGGFSIYDGFTDAEKFQSLASGLGKSLAGPGDISFVVSTGPLNIGPSDTASIGFAVAGGFNIDDLRSAMADARVKYKTLINDTTRTQTPHEYILFQNYPNPFNPNTIIQYNLPEQSNVLLKVYDILGNEVRTLIDGPQGIGKHNVEFKVNGLASGIYFYRIQAGSFKAIKKMVILK